MVYHLLPLLFTIVWLSAEAETVKQTMEGSMDLQITYPESSSPRTFMELTTDRGVWIGDFFIAPYVSIGTIVGIPAETLFSIAIKRKFDKKKREKINLNKV